MDLNIKMDIDDIKNIVNNLNFLISSRNQVTKLLPRKRISSTKKIFSTIKEARIMIKRKEYLNFDRINDAVKIINKKVFIKKENSQKGEFVKLFNKFIQDHKSARKLRRQNRRKIDKNIIYEIVSNQGNKILTLSEILFLYRQKRPNLNLSVSTIRRYLKEVLGFNYSSVNYVHQRQSLLENNIAKFLFLNQLSHHLKNESCLIYVDESCFQQNSLRVKTWNNKSIKTKLINSGRTERITIIGAISDKKIILIKKSYATNDSNDFVNFLKNLELELKKCESLRDFIKKKKICIICDNCKIHYCKNTIKFMKKSSFNVLFQSPYTPTVNPIELLWGSIKTALKKKHIMNL